MCLETLRHLKPNHKRPLGEMTGDEVIEEYLFLRSGHADTLALRGQSMGLTPELEARRDELHRHIVSCVGYHCPLPVEQ